MNLNLFRFLIFILKCNVNKITVEYIMGNSKFGQILLLDTITKVVTAVHGR